VAAEPAGRALAECDGVKTGHPYSKFK